MSQNIFYPFYYGTFYNKEIVHFLDPSLKVICREKISSTGVFKVKKDNEVCIFKLALSKDLQDFEHLGREIFALSKCQGIQGIPRILKIYNEKEYLGLLREFIDGEKKYVLNKREKAKLEEIVRTLHRKGFVRLDLRPDNIIWKKEMPFLIDLGQAIDSSKMDKQTTHYFKYADLKTVYNYCFPQPIRINF